MQRCRNFLRNVALMAGVLAGLPGSGWAQAITAATPAAFAPADDPAFAGYRAPLLAYLRAKGPRSVNTVCMLGERASDGSAWVWVFWREGRRMVLWEGEANGMVHSRRDLDLQRDVVSDAAGVQGSTYRVTASFVAIAKQQCAAHGTTVRLRRGQVTGVHR